MVKDFRRKEPISFAGPLRLSFFLCFWKYQCG